MKQDNVQVSCHHCHWKGRFKDLKPVSVPNPILQGDIIREFSCPSCHQTDEIEFREPFWERWRIYLIQRKHNPTLEDGIEAITRMHTNRCRFFYLMMDNTFQIGLLRLYALGGVPYVPYPDDVRKDIALFQRAGLKTDMYQWLADRYGMSRMQVKTLIFPIMYGGRLPYVRTTHPDSPVAPSGS